MIPLPIESKGTRGLMHAQNGQEILNCQVRRPRVTLRSLSIVACYSAVLFVVCVLLSCQPRVKVTSYFVYNC